MQRHPFHARAFHHRLAGGAFVPAHSLEARAARGGRDTCGAVQKRRTNLHHRAALRPLRPGYDRLVYPPARRPDLFCFVACPVLHLPGNPPEIGVSPGCGRWDARCFFSRTLPMIAMRPSFSSVLILALTMLVCAGCTKGARKDRCLARGDRDFGAESYDEAEIEYRKALQLVPFDPTAVRQLGYLYFNEGRLPLAYVYLRKAAELRPEDNDVRVKLGMCELPLGLVKEAREAARRVLQSQPETKDALLLLADSSRKSNEAEAARRVLQSLPETKDALLLLADSSRKSNEAEDARQLIEKLRQQGKDRSGYHLAVGSLRMAQRDTDGAEKEFTRALELDPKSSDAYAGLGEVYWNRHDLKKADQALKSAADNAPLRSTRRLRYAEFKAETGAASEARKILDEMTGKAPDYIPAWVLAMRLAFDERWYDDCDAAIKRILARDNGNYEALLQRGNLKLARGDAAGAGEEIEHPHRGFGRGAQLQKRPPPPGPP